MGAVTEAGAGAGSDAWAAALAAGGRGFQGFDPGLGQGPPPSAQLWGQNVWEEEASSGPCSGSGVLGPSQTRSEGIPGLGSGGTAPAGRRRGSQAATWGPVPVMESAGQAPRELPWFLEEPEPPPPQQTAAHAQPQAPADSVPAEQADPANVAVAGAAAAAQPRAAAGKGPGSGFADWGHDEDAHARDIFSPVPRSASASLAAARADGLGASGPGSRAPLTRAASWGRDVLALAEAGVQADMAASTLLRQGARPDPLNRNTGRPAWVSAAGAAGRPWTQGLPEGFASPDRARHTVLARAAWSLPAGYGAALNPALRSVRSGDARAPEPQAHTLEQRISAARLAGGAPPGPGEGIEGLGVHPPWAGASGQRWAPPGLQRQGGPAWWAEPGFQNPGGSPPQQPSLLARTRTLAGRLLHRARSAERPSPDPDPNPGVYGRPRRPGAPAYQGPGEGFLARPPRRSRSYTGDARPPAWLAELQGLDQGWGLGEVTAEQLERERDAPRGPLRRASALPRPSVLDQARTATQMGAVGMWNLSCMSVRCHLHHWVSEQSL